jgi:hypothetical protein
VRRQIAPLRAAIQALFLTRNSVEKFPGETDLA